MKSYFKFLSRNKLYTAIELFGLSVALGFVVLLVSYATMEYRVGATQPLSKNLYAVGYEDYYGMTLGTAPEFFPSIPDIKSWTRVAKNYFVDDLAVGEEKYQVSTMAVDTNFLQLFDYELEGASRQRLFSSDQEVILSRSFARRLFGADSPIGRVVKADTLQLTVTGVIEDFDADDVFPPVDMLMNIHSLKGKIQWMDQFGSVIPFVLLDDQTNVEQLRATLLDKYLAYWDFYTRDDEGGFIKGSTLTRLDHLYLNDAMKSYTSLRKGSHQQVVLLFVLAVVLLVSAVFNYINLTVAQAGKRAKEMATRRLLGESVAGVVGRYLRESALFTTGCFLMGCLIAWALRPLFNEMLQTSISLLPTWMTAVWAVVAVVLLSLVCGSLPALMVSRFNPIDVVRGSLRLRSNLYFSKVFIVAQNVISAFFLAVALTMALQVYHLVTLPTGYRTDGLLEVQVHRLARNADLFAQAMQRIQALPQVKRAVQTQNYPGQCGFNGSHDADGNLTSWLCTCYMDTAAMNLLDIRIVEQYEAPTQDKVWVTREAQRYYGITREHRYIGGTPTQPEREVCGVVEDFRANHAVSTPVDNAHNVISSIDTRKGYGGLLLVEVQGDRAEALAAVRRCCDEMSKERVGYVVDMGVKYLDDIQYEALLKERNMMHLVLTFMGISLLISALGLFAMSVYYSEQQRRQIALRKVMGATVRQAVWTLSRRFLLMSLVAVVIALPLSYKAMERYLSDFYYRIDFPWWVLPLAALFTLWVAFCSVISRTLQVAKRNPIESLKRE